jgi:hypothetical protein
MDTELTVSRKQTIEKILARQDAVGRWGFGVNQSREHTVFLYYSPNYQSTFWTLLMLADLKAPADLPQIQPSLRLITERFYAPEYGIFRLPGMTHFPIPCLNGSMIYLHYYFSTSQAEILPKVIDFFADHQRFDDGDFQTPKAYPYCSNTACYGRHTCYWGVTKLLKGISFIPKAQRSQAAQQLIGNCIEFVLHHEVCFSSHQRDKLLHPDIGKLTLPNSWKMDFLEILWLLAREEVRDRRLSLALDLLRSRKKDTGFWELEKPMDFIVSTGKKGCANSFITERATEVLDYYQNW